jgi:sugar phosphate isomerase/epimerase
VAHAGFDVAHWSFAAIGIPTLAEGVAGETFARVRAGFDARDIAIPSVSATYNVVHPDGDLRRRQTVAAVELIARIPTLGADLATLCSGTRDPDDMWRGHPDNASTDAWSDLRETLDVLLAAADTAGIRLGIEPEPGNVIRDAAAAARLLEELGPDAPVGIIFDPANLLSPATIPDQGRILREAVELLGPRILGAHAKDVLTGAIDYHLVFRLLAGLEPMPLIVQDVAESDAARVHHDLRRWDEEAVHG